MSDDLKPTDKLLPNGRVVRGGVTYGCHCDTANDDEVDGCVLDYGAHGDCLYSVINGKKRRSRWTCSEWRRVKARAAE